jgi:RimJ/RimL family protein N-acetyltransferase
MTEFAHRVPGFGTVRVTPLDAGDPRHVALVHGWVTQERARFWGMTGLSRDDVRALYAHMATLDTHHAHLVYRDGEPAALVQTYDPAADRVSECYDADPADIGLHLLIAPAAGAAEPGFTGRLLSGVVAFLFADPARRRVVAEPDARNEKAIRRLARTGFRAGPEVTLREVDLPEVYLPAKRARLMFLPRPAAGAGPDADPEADSGPDAGV